MSKPLKQFTRLTREFPAVWKIYYLILKAHWMLPAGGLPFLYSCLCLSPSGMCA